MSQHHTTAPSVRITPAVRANKRVLLRQYHPRNIAPQKKSDRSKVSPPSDIDFYPTSDDVVLDTSVLQHSQSRNVNYNSIDRSKSTTTASTMTTRHKSSLKYRIIGGVLLVMVSLSVYYAFGDYLTFDALRTHHNWITDYISDNPRLAPLLYTIIVAIVVGLTLPGATVLSMAAGLIFEQPYASIYAWLGCGLGAVLCFLFVRSICGAESCLSKMGNNKYLKWLRDFETGLHRNELLYLIFVRYMIIIPFWFVNVAAALLGASLHNFVLSTFVAIIPGSLLYTTAGRGLVTAFQLYSDEISVFLLLKQVLNTPEMKYCIALLLLCLIVPIAIKIHSVKQNRSHNTDKSKLV